MQILSFKSLARTVTATSAYEIDLISPMLMRGLADAPVPLPCPPLPMYMIWHLRHQHDPAHRWLRGQLERCVPARLARSPNQPA